MERIATSVLFTVAEVDTLAALGGRRGATLLPELRRAYTGDRLGFQYADPDKRLPIDRHSYRMGLLVGIQPGRAGALSDDADGGTPQRFLWASAIDPDAPDDRGDEPEPWLWKLPPYSRMPTTTSWLTPLKVCQTAQDAIDANRLATLRGNGNSTSGHALLIRLKVAAALALLDQRTGVDDDDWELAGLVMAHSDQVRERMAAHMAAARRQENAASGQAAAYRAAIVEDTLAERAVRRACDWLRRRLPNLCDEEGWVAHVVLLRSATSRDRQHLATALELLTQSGEVESSEAARTASGHGGRGVRYRLRTAKP